MPSLNATLTSARVRLDDAGFVMADGQPLDLAPKERAVLALLLRHPAGVVSKHAFAATAWGGGEMSDESLARSISRVRRALAPYGLAIDSVYGTGYRLAERAPAPADPAVLDAYQHAQQLAQQRTPAGMGRAIELLRALVEREPGFAPARVALADGLAAAVGWGLLPTLASVDEGLALLAPLMRSPAPPPGLHAARGALLDMAWRFDEAHEAHALALRSQEPTAASLLAWSRHLLFTGSADEAVHSLQQALRLSPHTALLRTTLSRALAQAGRGEEALAQARQAVSEHPGQLLLVAFELAMRALVAPVDALEPAARRLGDGPDPPPFAWTVLSFVLARLGRREAALDIVDAALMCSRTTAGEATLYAAPLAALGEVDRAAALLQRAFDERCGMLAMVLRDPANAGWLAAHTTGQALMREVFGAVSPPARPSGSPAATPRSVP